MVLLVATGQLACRRIPPKEFLHHDPSTRNLAGPGQRVRYPATGRLLAVAFLGTLTQFFIGGSEFEGMSRQGDAHLSLGLEQQGVIAPIARPLFTDYIIVLEVTGILLLTAIVGTIFLTKKRSV